MFQSYPIVPCWLSVIFTRDGRWSTYDVIVLKLSNVSFRGKCARMENTLKLPPTKLDRLGHFHPASQAGRLARPVFYVCICFFSGFLDGLMPFCVSACLLPNICVANLSIYCFVVAYTVYVVFLCFEGCLYSNPEC
jgi:hypothetical protein